jgi:hypothetical protein
MKHRPVIEYPLIETIHDRGSFGSNSLRTICANRMPKAITDIIPTMKSGRSRRTFPIATAAPIQVKRLAVKFWRD